MATVRHGRMPRKAFAKQPAASIWRPTRKALAAILRKIATELNVAHAVCVTVQAALRGQDADEDGEMELRLRTHVADPISRQVDELRTYAQQLAPPVNAVRQE